MAKRRLSSTIALRLFETITLKLSETITLKLFAAFMLLAAVQAQANELNRAEYGATQMPIWSPLHWFERDALVHLGAAHAGAPNALLALYLIASGVRDQATFETVNRRIRAEVRDLREVLGQADDPLSVGAALNQRMHQRFFTEKGESKAPSGYATEQSRLMGIFETGEFNCISSAMLYALLARHFDLDVQGVLLPSHAFIQLNTNAGAIDIETTSPQGFNQLHTEEFYARQSEQWHQVRDLAPATWADYQARKRISPLRLAAVNMLNQHTAASEMRATDSARLAEISAYLYPHDEIAQHKRLNFYNSEARQLSQGQQWPTLKRLFERTYVAVTKDLAEMGNPESLTEPLLYYTLTALLTQAQLAAPNETWAIVDDLLSKHPAIPEQKANIEAEIANALRVLVRQLAAQTHYSQALEVPMVAAAKLPDGPDWRPLSRWVYATWVEDLWEQSDWQQAVTVALDWWEDPLLESDEKAFAVLRLAQHNLVLAALTDGEIETASAHVELCELSLPTAACQSARNLLNKARQQNASQGR